MLTELWTWREGDGCVSNIDKQLMQSHGMREVMQQTVMQKQVYIIQIYTQANREEYLAMIACSMIIKIIYNQKNQSCQSE